MASVRMTLSEYAKSMDPDGSQAQIIEVLNEVSPMVQDAVIKPSNALLGNTTTIRKTLPAFASVKVNQGVDASVTLTEQKVDTIGMFEGAAETDARLPGILGMADFQTRRRQDLLAFAEKAMETIHQYLLYGSTLTDEAGFDGFMPRMDALNTTDLGSSLVFNMASSVAVSGSDGCSILVVDWGENACSLLYPKNSVAGLETIDEGKVRVLDSDSKPYMAYLTTLRWKIGLGVDDKRHMARLANIDLSDSLLASPTQGNLYRELTKMLDLMPDPGTAQRVLYAPQRLYSAFRLQAMEKTNLALTLEEYLGKFTPHFQGYPIRKVQRMAVNESTVS
jgi:hypothetical protein